MTRQAASLPPIDPDRWKGPRKAKAPNADTFEAFFRTPNAEATELLTTDRSRGIPRVSPPYKRRARRSADSESMQRLGLGSNRVSAARQERQDKRASRYTLRTAMQQIEGVGWAEDADGDAVRMRFGFCGAAFPEDGFNPAPAVTIRERVDESGRTERRASMSGVQRCQSPWVCPVCSPLLRTHRADEIELGAKNWQEQGGGLALLTLTIRHSTRDSLIDLRQGLTKCFSRLQGSRRWRRMKAEFGLRGMMRALDLTHGSAAGWHPHLHVLLVLDASLTEAQLAGLRGEFAEQWASLVERHMGRKFRPRRDEKGVDLRAADEGAGDYALKVREAWGVSSEVARTDAKKAAPGRRTPVQIMANAADESRTVEELARDRALLREYAEATRGVPAVAWSKGLKDLLGVRHVDDAAALDEAQAGEDADGSEIVSEERVSLAGHFDYATVPHGAQIAQWLNIAEDYGAAGLRRYLRGLPPEEPPPAPPPPPPPPEPVQADLFA